MVEAFGAIVARACLRLSLLALPAELRSGIEADLHESMPAGPEESSARGSWAMCREVLAIAWHYQAECHRTHEARLRLSVLLAACASLMFLVPPALRTALRGWSTVHQATAASGGPAGLLLSLCPALAAGLVLGLFAPKQPHLAGSQNLVVAVLVLIAFSHHEWPQALAGIAAMALGLWLGRVRRRVGLEDSR